MFVARRSEYHTQELLVVLWCSYRQYYSIKAKIKLCGKMLIAEIDMKHVKLDFYKVYSFLRV